MGSKQQIIAVQLFFDEGAPCREEMMGIGRTLCERFVRMRGIPVDVETYREWKDVDDVEQALQKIIVQQDLKSDTKDEARLFLEKVKGQDILTSMDGIEVPLWRCYMVGQRCITLCIDHAIADGLSLSTLLAVVATVSPDGPNLTLEEVSPILKRIVEAGDGAISFLPWRLLWPLNLYRAFRAMRPAFTAKTDVANPLQPIDLAQSIEEEKVIPIPKESFGTIYFIPVEIKLCRLLANALGVTINDVVLATVYSTICQYFADIGFVPDGDTMQHALPVGVPKPPSMYLDAYEGLNVQMTPTLQTFSLKQVSFRERVQTTHESMIRLKESNVGVLMKLIVDNVASRMGMDAIAEDMGKSLGKATFCWSNVPGPSFPVFLAGHKITEIQTLVSNPFCMMQAVSYNGVIYTSIQVDLRNAKEADKLAHAFVKTFKSAIEEVLPSDEEKEAALKTIDEAVASHNPGPFHM